MSSRVQDRARRKQTGAKPSQKNSTWKRQFSDNGDGAMENQEELSEKEQCLICAEMIEIAALGACNHTVCHKCAFRQRALYRKQACLVCRTENEDMVLTDQLGKEYSDFNISNPQNFAQFDETYSMYFTSQRAHDVTMELLTYRCQICLGVESDFKTLAEHVRGQHDKFICTICSNNKKAFPSELKIYTYKQLQNHQIRGDERGFTGHPLCKFCKGRRFYSEDELNVHLRESHEKCHVCNEIDPSNPQYFKNYDSLEEHFRRDHFICAVQSCLDQKFIVFADELDLQAHMLSVHGEQMFRPANGGSRQFHSQLSTFPSRSTNSNSRGQSSNKTESTSFDTKKLRFEERARHYLNYSNSDFKTFTKINNSYKNSEIDASGLKLAYEDLFKQNSESEIYLLLFDFSELFAQKSEKFLELSSMVKDHEQNARDEEDFPALPGSSTSLNASWGNNWNNRENGRQDKTSQKKALEEQFPALPSVHSSKKMFTPVNNTVRYKTITKQTRPVTTKVNSIPSTYVPSYLSNTAKTSPSSSRSNFKLKEEEFPELPKAPPKKVIPRVNPVPKGNGAWDTSSPSNNSSAFNLNSMNDALPNPSAVVTKKGKKKKQILFSLGGH